MASFTYLVFLLFCVSFVILVPQDITTPTDPPKKFRNDYKYEPSTEHFYKAHKTLQKFQEAVDTCKFEGAELAVPRTEGEADVLRNMFREGSEAIWVGLHDIYGEGEFMTVNGISIEQVYNNWEPREPNNEGDNEDCVIMNSDKRYNDIPCNLKFNFICAKPESEVKYQWLCETYDKDYFYNIEGDRCYKLHKVPRSWREAYKICRAEEAGLVVVNSETEANFLKDMFNSQSPETSIQGKSLKQLFLADFSDLLSPGLFLTSDGKSLAETGFDKWSPGQPDNYGGDEHCGSLFRSGLLNDVDCKSKALFFCEKILGAPQSFSVFARSGFSKHNSA